MVPHSLAIGACKVDDLEMELCPQFLWIERFEIFFCFFSRLTLGQAPAPCTAMYVCVYRKRWHMKCLRHNDRCCFVANAWQRFELCKRAGYCTAVKLYELFGELYDVFSLAS